MRDECKTRVFTDAQSLVFTHPQFQPARVEQLDLKPGGTRAGLQVVMSSGLAFSGIVTVVTLE